MSNHQHQQQQQLPDTASNTDDSDMWQDESEENEQTQQQIVNDDIVWTGLGDPDHHHQEEEEVHGDDGEPWENAEEDDEDDNDDGEWDDEDDDVVLVETQSVQGTAAEIPIMAEKETLLGHATNTNGGSSTALERTLDGTDNTGDDRDLEAVSPSFYKSVRTLEDDPPADIKSGVSNKKGLVLSLIGCLLCLGIIAGTIVGIVVGTNKIQASNEAAAAAGTAPTEVPTSLTIPPVDTLPPPLDTTTTTTTTTTTNTNDDNDGLNNINNNTQLIAVSVESYLDFNFSELPTTTTSQRQLSSGLRRHLQQPDQEGLDMNISNADKEWVLQQTERYYNDLLAEQLEYWDMTLDECKLELLEDMMSPPNSTAMWRIIFQVHANLLTSPDLLDDDDDNGMLELFVNANRTTANATTNGTLLPNLLLLGDDNHRDAVLQALAMADYDGTYLPDYIIQPANNTNHNNRPNNNNNNKPDDRDDNNVFQFATNAGFAHKDPDSNQWVPKGKGNGNNKNQLMGPLAEHVTVLAFIDLDMGGNASSGVATPAEEDMDWWRQQTELFYQDLLKSNAAVQRSRIVGATYRNSSLQPPDPALVPDNDNQDEHPFRLYFTLTALFAREESATLDKPGRPNSGPNGNDKPNGRPNNGPNGNDKPNRPNNGQNGGNDKPARPNNGEEGDSDKPGRPNNGKGEESDKPGRPNNGKDSEGADSEKPGRPDKENGGNNPENPQASNIFPSNKQNRRQLQKPSKQQSKDKKPELRTRLWTKLVTHAMTKADYTNDYLREYIAAVANSNSMYQRATSATLGVYNPTEGTWQVAGATGDNSDSEDESEGENQGEKPEQQEDEEGESDTVLEPANDTQGDDVDGEGNDAEDYTEEEESTGSAGEPSGGNDVQEDTEEEESVTEAPTGASTEAPSKAPTGAPTGAPSEAPTGAPTGAPPELSYEQTVFGTLEFSFSPETPVYSPSSEEQEWIRSQTGDFFKKHLATKSVEWPSGLVKEYSFEWMDLVFAPEQEEFILQIPFNFTVLFDQEVADTEGATIPTYKTVENFLRGLSTNSEYLKEYVQNPGPIRTLFLDATAARMVTTPDPIENASPFILPENFVVLPTTLRLSFTNPRPSPFRTPYANDWAWFVEQTTKYYDKVLSEAFPGQFIASSLARVGGVEKKPDQSELAFDFDVVLEFEDVSKVPPLEAWQFLQILLDATESQQYLSDYIWNEEDDGGKRKMFNSVSEVQFDDGLPTIEVVAKFWIELFPNTEKAKSPSEDDVATFLSQTDQFFLTELSKRDPRIVNCTSEMRKVLEQLGQDPPRFITTSAVTYKFKEESGGTTSESLSDMMFELDYIAFINNFLWNVYSSSTTSPFYDTQAIFYGHTDKSSSDPNAVIFTAMNPQKKPEGHDEAEAVPTDSFPTDSFIDTVSVVVEGKMDFGFFNESEKVGEPKEIELVYILDQMTRFYDAAFTSSVEYGSIFNGCTIELNGVSFEDDRKMALRIDFTTTIYVTSSGVDSPVPLDPLLVGTEMKSFDYNSFIQNYAWESVETLFYDVQRVEFDHKHYVGGEKPDDTPDQSDGNMDDSESNSNPITDGEVSSGTNPTPLTDDESTESTVSTESTASTEPTDDEVIESTVTTESAAEPDFPTDDATQGSGNTVDFDFFMLYSIGSEEIPSRDQVTYLQKQTQQFFNDVLPESSLPGFEAISLEVVGSAYSLNSGLEVTFAASVQFEEGSMGLELWPEDISEHLLAQDFSVYINEYIRADGNAAGVLESVDDVQFEFVE